MSVIRAPFDVYFSSLAFFEQHCRQNIASFQYSIKFKSSEAKLMLPLYIYVCPVSQKYFDCVLFLIRREKMQSLNYLFLKLYII